MRPDDSCRARVAPARTRWGGCGYSIWAAAFALLVALGGAAPAVAQVKSAAALPDPIALTRAAAGAAARQDSTQVSPPSTGSSHRLRKVTRQLGELEPVLEWQWGAIFATALAMAGAVLLTLPVALVYMWTKPAHAYDPSVMHSSIILAPTIAGILIVIQGSLAMAFSLAGVATAVRFRNSLKDTNDAVYVFVAVAIGLAAGGQALDIALAISVIFSVVVLLLSKSPFRVTGNSHHPAPDHHHHHEHDGPPATSPGGGSGAFEYLTIRASDAEPARRAVEQVLDRETKRWRLERATREANGAVGLLYAVRCRKRTPRDALLAELRTIGDLHGFTIGAAPAPPPATPTELAGPGLAPARQAAG